MPSIFQIVDASECDGLIVQMMFILLGDWEIRMRSMGISFLYLVHPLRASTGCREKAETCDADDYR
jgi:hypothetical protein